MDQGASNDRALVPMLDDRVFLPGILDAEVEQTQRFIRAARADATHRGYAADWRVFAGWCAARGIDFLPASPETVAVFISAMASGDASAEPPRPPRKIATLSRYLAAINYHHRQARLATPGDQDGGIVLRNAFAGIKRSIKNDKVQKSAADGDRLGRMLAAIVGEDERAARDRALLALGMSAALRRSELVALDVSDIMFVAEGLTVLVRSSKTDQTGEGVIIAVPEGRRIRPKALLLEWLRIARLREGPLFRTLIEIREKLRDPATGDSLVDSLTGKTQWRRVGDRIQETAMNDRGVALVVKARALQAGLDPALFAGHSLRSGFLTEAARQPNANIFKMREVSRHKSLEILSSYVRSYEKFRDHAGEGFL